MKKEVGPDDAKNQSKIVPPPLGSRLSNARQPKRTWGTVTVNGRPFSSTWARILGPIPTRLSQPSSFDPLWLEDPDECLPCAAEVWNVLVGANVDEFATLITDMMMTALKTEESALMPTSSMALTKGECRDSDPLELYNLLQEAL